jgi:anti-anti-sigma regulatory factor
MPLRPTALKVAPTDLGCCIRIEGRGTMQESHAARDLALRTLDADPGAVVLYDLSDCDYLDSTFLGSVLELWRRFGKASPARYMVVATADRRRQLFGACGIDRLIVATETPPELRGEWCVLPASGTRNSRELMRHVMECHRTLAQVDSPMRAAFARIADQIEKDLAKAPAM